MKDARLRPINTAYIQHLSRLTMSRSSSPHTQRSSRLTVSKSSSRHKPGVLKTFDEVELNDILDHEELKEEEKSQVKEILKEEFGLSMESESVMGVVIKHKQEQPGVMRGPVKVVNGRETVCSRKQVVIKENTSSGCIRLVSPTSLSVLEATGYPANLMILTVSRYSHVGWTEPASAQRPQSDPHSI